MNNLKKVGLTALASSLVAASAYAGEVTVAGGASMQVKHNDGGGAANSGKSFSMGNQLTFSGSGELDNGLNVSISFVIDQGDDSTAATPAAVNPFDNHSITVSSDSLGSITMAGEGGSSAQGAIDTTAAGDLWDNTFTTATVTGSKPKASAAGSNGLTYVLPSVVDGFGLTASYAPKGSGADSSTAFAVSYTGVEGLTLNYAVGEDNSTAGSTADVTTMKASYAYGPITVAVSDTEYDDETANQDQQVSSFNISYTVSDAISISYGEETIEDGTTNSATNLDAETKGITATYTAGGMTLTGQSVSGDNMDFSASTLKDYNMWRVSASFAF